MLHQLVYFLLQVMMDTGTSGYGNHHGSTMLPSNLVNSSCLERPWVLDPCISVSRHGKQRSLSSLRTDLCPCFRAILCISKAAALQVLNFTTVNQISQLALATVAAIHKVNRKPKPRDREEYLCWHQSNGRKPSNFKVDAAVLAGLTPHLNRNTTKLVTFVHPLSCFTLVNSFRVHHVCTTMGVSSSYAVPPAKKVDFRGKLTMSKMEQKPMIKSTTTMPKNDGQQ